jgi:hypothetical protein
MSLEAAPEKVRKCKWLGKRYSSIATPKQIYIYVYKKESWKYGKSWKSGWTFCLFHRGNVFLSFFLGVIADKKSNTLIELIKNRCSVMKTVHSGMIRSG